MRSERWRNRLKAATGTIVELAADPTIRKAITDHPKDPEVIREVAGAAVQTYRARSAAAKLASTDFTPGAGVPPPFDPALIATEWTAHSGAATESDFVEVPSTLLEKWQDHGSRVPAQPHSPIEGDWLANSAHTKQVLEVASKQVPDSLPQSSPEERARLAETIAANRGKEIAQTVHGVGPEVAFPLADRLLSSSVDIRKWVADPRAMSDQEAHAYHAALVELAHAVLAQGFLSAVQSQAIDTPRLLNAIQDWKEEGAQAEIRGTKLPADRETLVNLVRASTLPQN